MADSPWNAKHARQSEPETFQPESARVQGIPISPPAPQTPLPTNPQVLQAQPPPQKPQRRKRISGTAKPGWLVAVVFALLALALTAAAFSYAHETARLNTLIQGRDEMERKAQAHRDEHLNARSRSGYMELIRKYAEVYNISPSMVSAIIKCESSFDPAAVSRVDARGLMQIMPGTGMDIARWLGISDYIPDNLFNPDFNIRFGTYYLARLSDQFGGNPVMVAAAFHAGDNNVKLWALDRAADMKTITLDMIPMDNTRSYVRKVMDAYAIYYAADSAAQTSALPSAVPSDGGIRGTSAGN